MCNPKRSENRILCGSTLGTHVPHCPVLRCPVVNTLLVATYPTRLGPSGRLQQTMRRCQKKAHTGAIVSDQLKTLSCAQASISDIFIKLRPSPLPLPLAPSLPTARPKKSQGSRHEEQIVKDLLRRRRQQSDFNMIACGQPRGRSDTSSVGDHARSGPLQLPKAQPRSQRPHDMVGALKISFKPHILQLQRVAPVTDNNSPSCPGF